jgi:predicted RNase H-related nuclease YkuK (DUF458 family)
MEKDPKAHYEILIGTDSSSGPQDVDFVSAIVIHKLGKGGRYFWTRTRKKQVPSLRQKIWREAWMSFELAQRVLETKEMIDEVVGMIIGSGLAVRIKPQAYAASSVADKYT